MSSLTIKRAKGAKYAKVMEGVRGEHMESPTESDVAGELMRAHYEWVQMLDGLVNDGLMSIDALKAVNIAHVDVASYNFDTGFRSGREGMDYQKINTKCVEVWDAIIARAIEGHEVQ